MTIAQQIASPTGLHGSGLPWESSGSTPPGPPVLVSAPVITNSLYAGGSITLTDAVWSGVVTSHVRDVLVDGVVVVDDAPDIATVAAYVLLLAQEGLVCVVRSIATGPGGTVSSDSAPVTIEPTAYLAGDWSASTGYVTAADANTDAVLSAPKIVAVAYRASANPTGTMLSCRTAAGGFSLQWHATFKAQYYFIDGGGTLRTANDYAVLTPSADIQVTIATCAAVGGAGVTRVRTNKGTWQATASFTGYTAPAAGVKLAVGGARGAAITGPTNVEILGVAFGNTIPTDEQIDAWLDDVASEQRVMPFAQGTSWARTMRDGANGMTDLCARGTWTGTGGLDLSRNVSGVYSVPSVTQIAPPSFGWAFTDTGAYVPASDPEQVDGTVALDAVGPVSVLVFDDDQTLAVGSQRCADYLSGGTYDVATPLGAGGTAEDAEVIGMFLGINGTAGTEADRLQEESDYADLLAYLYTIKPNAWLLVSTLTPTEPQRAEATAFNASLPAIWDACSYETAGRLVRLDFYSALDRSVDLSDAVHPNDAGYVKMAPLVLAGLTTALASKRGRVRWTTIGDSITVGSGATDARGWRRIIAETYWPGPWSSQA